MSPLEPILRPITRRRLEELAEAGFGDMIKAVVDCRRRVIPVVEWRVKTLERPSAPSSRS